MHMMKELNVSAPLRKEMSDIVEKRRTLPRGSEEWTALNNRYYELLICWATNRMENTESNLSRFWLK